MSTDRKIFIAFATAVIGIIAIAVWNQATCAEWGPPQTVIIQQSCGDGCITFTPVETRACIRRKP